MKTRIIFTDRSDTLVNTYLKDISKHKILDKDTINELIIKAQSGDQQAKDKVVLSNLRFVVSVAKQFQNRGIPLADLISVGNEGLIRAIDKFDLSKEVTFLTYAVWWIKQAIYNSIYWQGREIRLPMSQQLLIISITKATDQFMQKNHRQPTALELSEMTEIPVDQIDYLSQFANSLVSVDDYIGGDEENNQICDIIPDDSESLDDSVNRLFVTEEINKILDKLTIREHDLMRMIYGIGIKSLSTKRICTLFGVGNERIRQMKESTLAKLRRCFKNKLKALI